eukprot:TRINITY_DN5352_c0_g1_i2.p1 TRINITY_DN5352_c0_g1~~TRINITY_DN5352_c0_g1_i2.p1  ORF type:complete len:522 (+),score=129.17 TRINITY_DN5352_c0_g1_i2:84-1649(+)
MRLLFCTVTLFITLINVILAEYNVEAPKNVHFVETFQGDWEQTWIPSKNEKYNGEWTVVEPTALHALDGDKALVVSSVARHHGLAAKFKKPLKPGGKDLIIQYEVKLQSTLECGGAYLKLLAAETMPNDLADFDDKTPYVIMFGPDKCGPDSMIHFIFRHQNPVTNEYEEKHMKNRPTLKLDKLTHLYTLHIKPDNTFTLSVDQEVFREGSLFEEFQPPVNPPKEIDDPEDKKPEDWVDLAEIPDPTATKPDDWDEDAPEEIVDTSATKPDTWLDDEPEQIPDPSTTKPEDWDEEFDGEWEAPLIPNPKCEESGCGEWKSPLIPNPKYRGKWRAPKIPNPAYKGVWKPRKIPNPDYFEDLNPHEFKSIGGIGFELWTMSEGITFDNILVTQDRSSADDFAAKTWKVKYEIEKAKDDAESGSSDGFFSNLWESVLDNPVIVGTVTTAILGIVVMLFFVRSGTKPPVQKKEKERSDKDSSERKENLEDVKKEAPKETEKAQELSSEKKGNQTTPKRTRTRKEN